MKFLQVVLCLNYVTKLIYQRVVNIIKNLADFSEAIKGKGLSSKEYALAINLFSFVYREKHHVESFGNTRESVVEYALDNFQIDWLVRRWDSVIKSKD